MGLADRRRQRVSVNQNGPDGGRAGGAETIRPRLRKGGKPLVTEEQMARKSMRIDSMAAPETLPPLSGRKLRKINHGKRLSKPDRSAFGVGGRKFNKAAKRRAKIFHGINHNKTTKKKSTNK